jgi:hypothetical protein
MRKGTLADFFAASPPAGSDLKIERVKGGLREIDFEALWKEVGGPDEDGRYGADDSPADRDRR